MATCSCLIPRQLGTMQYSLWGARVPRNGHMRIYIRDYARWVNVIQRLTHKDVPFKFGEEQIAAQNNIKDAVLQCPALKPIDYDSSSPVILAVDTSYITVGFYLCQRVEGQPAKWNYDCLALSLLTSMRSDSHNWNWKSMDSFMHFEHFTFML